MHKLYCSIFSITDDYMYSHTSTNGRVTFPDPSTITAKTSTNTDRKKMQQYGNSLYGNGGQLVEAIEKRGCELQVAAHRKRVALL